MPIRSPYFQFSSSSVVDPMRRSVLPILLLTFLLAGCDSGDVVHQEVAKVQVRLEIENLPPLESGFHYQAWARIGLNDLGTESFNKAANGGYINNSGQFVQNVFVFEDDVSSASQIFITIEDKRDSDALPSGSVVLAGDVVNSVATLSVTHELALGTGFGSAAGQFMLFSNAFGGSASDMSGVWFTGGNSTTLTPGLTLPALPDGWVYEGWIELGDALLSTGTFRDGNTHDLNRRYSNTDTPPFPGEDFLENAPAGVTFPINPASGIVKVTVEPFPDDWSAPFGITVLSGTVPAAPSARTPYPMSASFAAPSGTATLF